MGSPRCRSCSPLRPDPRRRELAGDALRLIADEAGVPGDPVVLLLHGGGQTRASWGGALTGLAAAGLHVLSLDMRGHGESDWAPDGRYDVASIAGDLAAVVDQLTGPVVLVGASLGGLACLVAAARLGDRVRALVLVDVVPRMQQQGVDRITAFMEAHAGGFATPEEAAAAVGDYLPRRREGGVTAGLRRNLRERPDGRWVWHWDPRLLTTAERPDTPGAVAELEARSAELTGPVVLVRGLLSDVVDDEGVERFRALVPQLRVVDLAGAAHTAAADDNEGFTDAVCAVVLASRAQLP